MCDELLQEAGNFDRCCRCAAMHFIRIFEAKAVSITRPWANANITQLKLENADIANRFIHKTRQANLALHKATEEKVTRQDRGDVSEWEVSYTYIQTRRTHTDIHHTHSQAYRQTQTDTDEHRRTQKDIQTFRQAFRHTDTHTHTHIYIRACLRTCIVYIVYTVYIVYMVYYSGNLYATIVL